MKARPILFSGPMVRALLAGTKTQTRRIVKPQDRIKAWENGSLMTDRGWLPCLDNPYGSAGDRLWVKETFALWDAFTTDTEGDLHKGKMPIPNEESLPEWRKRLVYRADDQYVSEWKWRPSIFMPRWASRITLELTGVRVERLQDISAEDAYAEGVHKDQAMWFDGTGTPEPVLCYASIWEAIHGPGSWAENPYVWVLEFRRIQP